MKELCLGLGVVFGSLIYFCSLFSIPCSILLVIAAIQVFEVGVKKKQHFELLIDEKFKNYESDLVELKSQIEKHKSDIDSMRMKLNLSAVYGKSQ